MSFQFFFCGNCSKENDDDSYLLIGFESEKELNKLLYTNSNLLSSSDNNNSTNHLEIIEYPYKSNNNKENINKENDSIKQMYYQIETNNIKKEKNFEDFDDDLLDIKPPKLFIEPYNNKADNNQLFEIEPKCKKEINKLVKKENSFNINPKEHIKMNSNNSESLINNDNSIMNNKTLLTNYYNISNNNTKFQNNLDQFIKEKNQQKERKISEINNLTINKEINHSLIGIKVNYQCLDTNNFYMCSNDKKSVEISNSKNKEVNTNNKSQKYEEIVEKKKNPFFQKRIKSKGKDRDKMHFSKFDFLKPKKAKSNDNVNIGKTINVGLEKHNKSIKLNQNEFKNQNIKKKKKLTFNSISKFDNKLSIIIKNAQDNLNKFFYTKEKNLIHRSNNFLLKNILHKKINNKNIFNSFQYPNHKNNKSYCSTIANQTCIFSTKTYVNPFIKSYEYKEKKI